MLIFRDTYSRTEVDQWSRPEQGNPWVSDEGGTAALDVNGSVGTITASVVGTRYRAGSPTPSAPWDRTVVVRTDKLAAGASQVVYLMVRRIDANNCYAIRLVFNTSAQVLLGLSKIIGGTETKIFAEAAVSGLTHAAGREFLVRLVFDGAYPTAIKAKVWQKNTAQPSTWALETTDATTTLQAAGGVGTGLQLETGTSNAPVVASFDDDTGDDMWRGLLVTNNPGDYLFRDTFTRTVVDGWGTPTLDLSGSGWILDAGTAANFDVNGSAGTIVVPAAGPASHQRRGNSSSIYNGTRQKKIRTNKLAVGGPQQFYLGQRRIAATSYYFVRLTFDTAQAVKLALGKMVGGTETLIGGSFTVAGLTHAADRDFQLKFQVAGIGANGSRLRAKVWQDGTFEPEGWQVTDTDNEATLQAAGGPCTGADLSAAATNAPVTFTVDDDSVLPVGSPRLLLEQPGDKTAPVEIRAKWLDPSPFGSRIIWARRSAATRFAAPWVLSPTPDIDTTTDSGLTGYAGGTRNRTTFADTSWRRRNYASLTQVPAGVYRVIGILGKTGAADDLSVRLLYSIGGATAAGDLPDVSLKDKISTDRYWVDLGSVSVPSDDSTLNIAQWATRTSGSGDLITDYFLVFPTESYAEFLVPAEVEKRWKGDQGSAVGGATLANGIAELTALNDAVKFPHATGLDLEDTVQHVFEFDIELESGTTADCQIRQVGVPDVSVSSRSISAVGRDKYIVRYEDTIGGNFYAQVIMTSSTKRVVVNRVRHSILRYGRQGQELRVNARERTARIYDSNGAYLRDARRRYDWPTMAAGDNEVLVFALDADGKVEGKSVPDRALDVWHRSIPRY